MPQSGTPRRLRYIGRTAGSTPRSPGTGPLIPPAPMYEAFPIWVLAADYVLGAVMWTLIGRFGMGLFLPEDSSFFFMRFFVRATNPLLRLFAPVTPGFLIQPLVPLFVAWFFFMIRFYLMPWLLGYSVMGMLSFPLESEIAHGIARVIGTFVH